VTEYSKGVLNGVEVVLKDGAIMSVDEITAALKQAGQTCKT
jgi:hypothetical protein